VATEDFIVYNMSQEILSLSAMIICRLILHHFLWISGFNFENWTFKVRFSDNVITTEKVYSEYLIVSNITQQILIQ